MTAAGPLGPLLEHWQLALAAGGAGVLLALAFLLAEYAVVPALCFRAAKRRGPASVAVLIGREARRVERLRDAAAILGEHAHPEGVGALGDEAGIRAVVLAVMLRRVR